MKKILLLLGIIALPLIVQAQDRMIKTDNTVLTVKIYEIGEEIIRYKPFDNQDGPMFTIRRSNVHKVILESGDEFVYSPLNQQNNTSTQSSVVLTDTQDNTSTNTSSNTSGTQTSNVSQDEASRQMNKLNTRKGTMSIFNFDIANSVVPEEGETGILIWDIFSYNMLFPMAGTDTDADVESSHGIVAHVAFKHRMVSPPTGGAFISSNTYIVDAGIGYGFNMKKDLRFYGTLNTATYITTTTTFYDDIPDQTFDDTFPENSGSLRLGAYWTPILTGGGNGGLGLHVAYDIYLAEGAENGFLIGLSFK